MAELPEVETTKYGFNQRGISVVDGG